MTHAAPSPHASNGSEPAAPLSFARWATATMGRWRVGVVVGGIVAGLVVLSAVVLPPAYRSQATFVANSSGGMKLPGSLGGLSGLAGMASQMGVSMDSDPSETPTFYVQLLHSRELLTRLAESRFADPRTGSPADSALLIEILDPSSDDPQRRMEQAIDELEDDLSPEGDVTTNLVRLNVDAEWPELSAAVANRAMALVSSFNLEQRTSRARSKREFVEERMGEAQRELAAAENRHRVFLEQNRVFRNSPALTAQEEQLRRQTQLASDLYTTLRREYETARINEVNDAPVVTVVDSAVAPHRPRWPRLVPLIVIALAAGGLFALLAAGSAALYSDWARRHPDEAADVRRVTGRITGRRVPRVSTSTPALPPAELPRHG